VSSSSGALLFARYAYPPNELGYCGPEDASPLLVNETTAVDEQLIAERARHFEGAWSYLELIASAAGFDDPLDARVVEAYWVGNDLLDGLDPVGWLGLLGERFRSQTGGFWSRLGVDSAALALPHHSFQVFAVYPWVGLLRSGSDVPLSVLNRCRIRWGEVIEVDGERAVVRSKPLTWDGQVLALGDVRDEAVHWSKDGRSLLAGVAVGDRVAMHWDWICDRLDARQLSALQASSAAQLELTNTQLAAQPT